MDANAGRTAWFDDVSLTGSKGIAARQNNVTMENATAYTMVLTSGTPAKITNSYMKGAYRNITVPTTGTVTVSATWF